MKDPPTKMTRLRPGDKVLVRRSHSWYQAVVISNAKGLVRVKYSYQTQYSWGGPVRTSTWFAVVPQDAESVRRDLSALRMTPAQLRAAQRKQAKARHQGQGHEESSRLTAQEIALLHARRSLEATRGTKQQQSYALYKGKRYTLDQLDAVLENERRRMPRVDPLRAQIESMREELETAHVNEPDCEFDEVYSVSDFSEISAADDRRWDFEDELGEELTFGRQGRAPRRPRTEREPRQPRQSWTDFVPESSWNEDQPQCEEELTAEDEENARNAPARDTDDQAGHAMSSGEDDARGWANPYDLPAAFGSRSDTGSSLSFSPFELSPFPTSSSASLLSHSSASYEPVSYSLPSADSITSGGSSASFYDFQPTVALSLTLEDLNPPAASHTFESDYCAASFSATINFDAGDQPDATSMQNNNTSKRKKKNKKDDKKTDMAKTGESVALNTDPATTTYHDYHHSTAVGSFVSQASLFSSNDFVGGAAKEEDDNEEDGDGEGGLNDLFGEEARARPQSRSSLQQTGEVPAKIAKKGARVKATGQPPHEEAPQHENTTSSTANVKAGVIDLRELKKRQKWEARLVKREEFKRRQRDERKRAAGH